MALRDRRDDAASREDGFTLVEMVVTVTVIAVLFLSVAVLLDSGLRALAASKARARGNDVATQAIEDLQRYSFNDLALCVAPDGTQPPGLQDTVLVQGSCTEDGPLSEQPCTDPAGSIPDEEYTCTRNNITYSVRRYVAWVDALQTTKRLAVFVEWTDLAGQHQVSQQSSLRAPDEAAIVGLAPPKFAEPPKVTITGGPTGDPVALDPDRTIAAPWTLTYEARTDNLDAAATANLNTPIPAHVPNDVFQVDVSTFAAFPNYNGFPVTIDGEGFKVLSGAGTLTWRLLASGTAPHSSTQVHFAGDQVYASIQTIGANDSPETASLLLTSFDGGTNWSKTIDDTSPLRFGAGSQYVSFGILRASDGKTTSSFAATQPRFCPSDGSCATLALPSVTTSADSVPDTIALGPGGELTNDLVLKVATTNVSGADTVTVSFLTRAGSLTVALAPDPAYGSCPGITEATVGQPCRWTAKLLKSAGYRFSTGPQSFYFGAQQVVDLDPNTIDKGSTAVAIDNSGTFVG